MPTKRWKLVVTDLGGDRPLSEVTTEGDNWMQALVSGRSRLGESGGVPSGASCVPAADGSVTVLDPSARRRYVLRREAEAQAEAQAKREPEPPSEDIPEVASELLLGRDEEPSPHNPLRYRERIYLVPGGSSHAQADAVLRQRFEALRDELATEPQGKFFNLAVFDHRWEKQPDRPPLATLQWKDWHGDPVVDHPTGPVSLRPTTSSRPPRSGTGEHDRRLAQTFEACQDLLFLSSQGEGVEFAVRLLAELVPAEAVAGCLYDINADEHRVVVATGVSAEAQRGRGLPAKRGLLAASVEVLGRVLRVDDVEADGRFEPEGEGRQGMTVRSALYGPLIASGHLLGMIQLLNRQGQPAFSESDVEVVRYVANQVADFVGKVRVSVV